MKPDIRKIPVTVDEIKYLGEDLSDNAKEMLSHVVDLRAKEDSLLFQLEQVKVAEHAFTIALQDTIRADAANSAVKEVS